MISEAGRIECLRLALNRQGAADPRPVGAIYAELLAIVAAAAPPAETGQPRRGKGSG